MKTKLRFTVLFAALLFACKKESGTSPNELSPKQYATLEVSVSFCQFDTDPSCEALIPVNGAKIYLFETKLHRDEHIGVLDEGTTSHSGKMTKSVLELPEYWVTIQLPQPDGRVEHEYVKTPLRTTTYLPVVFKEP